MASELESFKIRKETVQQVKCVVAKTKQTISGFIEIAVEKELRKAKYKNLLV